MKTTEQKIVEYIKAGYFDKKPRLTTKEVVEYANNNGATWVLNKKECEKHIKYAGMRYNTGGGTRTYKGYTVSEKGNFRDFFDSTETYRTIGDLLNHLPNYRELSNLE